jgi:hypothetical protein
MKKRWIIGGLVLGGIAGGAMIARRRLAAPYEDDFLDTAGDSSFGYREPAAAEQPAAPAETGTDAAVEEPTMAARIRAGGEAIRAAWPSISDEEIQQADGDLDRLAQRIAEKVEQPRDEIRRRLDDIIGQETPRPSYPAP